MSDVMTSILSGKTRDAASVEKLAVHKAITDSGPWASVA